MDIKFYLGNLKGMENFGDPNLERSTILEVDFKRMDYPCVE